ncbi:MAG: 30S ribosomal protein S12 methylthiotransferase RimO [Paludibacteraceae bacterium]|nr:30S ribosomal protein S12 methylthiotransferase RimO [Paludibacteraceae bacterium]
MKKSVDIITLGCSKNLVDSERLLRQFEANGFTVHHDPEKPKSPIVVINTCGFIGDAKEESINMILDFATAKKKHKLEKLFVMGCLSERYLKELQLEIPEVDKFYGKFNYTQLISDLGEMYRDNLLNDRVITTPNHYAYLKIAEGCNRTCSYCAIPIITGKYQSRPIEEILDEVRLLVSRGVKEFQLIAQDLTYYGLDIYHSYKIAELVDKIADIEGVEWIRLHYGYPAHFPMDLLDVMASRNNVCKYLDIALQHVSDSMLKKMRRNVSKQDTYNLIKLIREKVPGIHIRTTLMVGHPGETEEDFEELKLFVQDAQFERMGAFAYSEEDGTFAAENYKDDIPEEVKQSRLDELMLLQQKVSERINAEKVGRTYKVIIDKEDDMYFIGRTEYDSPDVDNEVLIPKENVDLKIGEFYMVKIVKSTEFDLIGELA